MRTIHVWPKRLREFLLTHPLYKSQNRKACNHMSVIGSGDQMAVGVDLRTMPM